MPDPIFWGAVFTALAALRYFRDDADRSVVDRGLERTTRTTKAKTLISTLAIVGFANIAMALHTVPSVWLSLYIDDTVDVPSYMRAGICGEGTDFACPGPDEPVHLRDNPPGATLSR